MSQKTQGRSLIPKKLDENVSMAFSSVTMAASKDARGAAVCASAQGSQLSFSSTCKKLSSNFINLYYLHLFARSR